MHICDLMKALRAYEDQLKQQLPHAHPCEIFRHMAHQAATLCVQQGVKEIIIEDFCHILTDYATVMASLRESGINLKTTKGGN